MDKDTVTREEMLAIPAMEIGDPAQLPPEPLVSILMITYNHESYIAEAIEGVLAQQCGFPIELIIGEDCSTDRTGEICREYQRKHPQLIRLVTWEENLGWCNNYYRILCRARGKYLALCEGDDTWTDPEKLAKQIREMEAHPDCTLCFTWIEIAREAADGTRQFLPIRREENPQLEFSLEEVLTLPIYAPTLTRVQRNGMVDHPRWLNDVVAGDWVEQLLYAERGPIRLIPEVTAIYRVHGGGVWSGSSEEYKTRNSVLSTRHLDRHFEGRYRVTFGKTTCKLLLALAGMEARRGDRRSAWLHYCEAWREADEKRWLFHREHLKFWLGFISNPLYGFAHRLSKRFERVGQA